MKIRDRTAVIAWLIGAAALFLYPPIQGIAHTVRVEPDTAEPGESMEPKPDVVFDARSTMWRWNVPNYRAGWTWTSYTFRVYEGRLLAQLGLWTAFVAAGAFVGGRVARWPGPAGTIVRWAALVAAGFASANVGLALLLAHPDLKSLSGFVKGGEWGSAGELVWEDLLCWGYGFVLPYAVLAWVLAALVGYLRRPDGYTRRDWTKEGSPGWAKGSHQWPREHWLGGPTPR